MTHPMDDVDRLLGWFARGKLLRPDPDRSNFVDLIAAVASWAGVAEPPVTPGAAELGAALGAPDHLVLVLVDGMGARAIERLPGDSFLRSHLHCELRSVFPSTTAAALTTLATGVWPGAHAAIGWWTQLTAPAISAVTLLFVERSTQRPLGELGVAPSDLFPVTAMWPRAARPPVTVVPVDYLGSVFSDYSSGATTCLGYHNLDQAARLVIDRVAGAGHPSFTYLYLPQLDELGHRVGVADRRFADLLGEFDRRLAELAGQLAGRARLVITADHGLVDPGDGGDRFLTAEDPLMELLVGPPSVEATVPSFHVAPDRVADFVAGFGERFGERFALIPAAVVEELGLLGPSPLHPATRRRLGTFLAIAGTPTALYYRPRRGRFHTHVAVHGGLSDAETAIPLILA